MQREAIVRVEELEEQWKLLEARMTPQQFAAIAAHPYAPRSPAPSLTCALVGERAVVRARA